MANRDLSQRSPSRRAFCAGATASCGEPDTRGLLVPRKWRGALIEPALRQSFAEHTQAELSRLTAGVAPEHVPLEITNGSRSMPLLVVERPCFGDPIEVEPVTWTGSSL